jgi:hypothetical protein
LAFRRQVGLSAPDRPAYDRWGGKELDMAYGVVHVFPDGTQEQYDATIAAVHPSDGSLPEGQLFHAAGQSSEGWAIVAVHESQESWERFRDGVLLPRLTAGIPGGFPEPPREMTFPVHNQAGAAVPG